MSYKEPTLVERMATSAKAKQAQLEKARAKSPANDPNFAERQEERRAIAIAREARVAERKAAKIREAEEEAAAEIIRANVLKVEEEARKVELANQKLREAAEGEERKAARAVRYAARKARRR